MAGTDNEFVVLVDMSQSDTQTQMTVAREVASKVNKLRKEFKLNFQDKIQIFFEPVQPESAPPANTNKPFEELTAQFAPKAAAKPKPAKAEKKPKKQDKKEKGKGKGKGKGKETAKEKEK